MTSSLPARAASINGVQPFMSRVSELTAPSRARRSLTTPACPVRAALAKGVRSSMSF
ncbi:hypothetical protein BDW72DRAFT_166758 [Aspergillus terricola var. indicus]